MGSAVFSFKARWIWRPHFSPLPKASPDAHQHFLLHYARVCSHHTGHSWHLKQSRVQVPTIAAVPRGRQTSLSIQALLMLYRIPLPAPQAPDLFSDATRLASIAPQREPELGDSGEEAQSWYFRCSLQQNPPKDIWVTQCLSPSHLSKCSCSFSLCSAPG